MLDDELLIHHVHIDDRALAALVPIRLNTTVTRLDDMILHPKKDIPRGVSAVLVRYIHEIQWSQSIKCGVYRIGRVRGFRSNSDAYGQRRGEHFCNERLELNKGQKNEKCFTQHLTVSAKGPTVGPSLPVLVHVHVPGVCF